MSGVVLVLGALLALAGVFEMVVGSGDILSERGWSAFIAGAVFVAGGMSTAALGLAVHAIDRLRLALQGPARVSSAVGPDASGNRLEPAPAALTDRALSVPPAEAVPDAGFVDAGFVAAGPAVVAMVPILTQDANVDAGAHPREPHAPAAEIPRAMPATADAAIETDEDWLDQSFADLHRAMAVEPQAPPTQPEIVAPESVEHALPHEEVADVGIAASEPVFPERHEPHAATAQLEVEPSPHASTVAADPRHEVAEPAPEPERPATVAAREEPAPAASPVIGRYESEGTSYVMYADGSIDAQSEAGVYRFASMAELKAFIEG